MKRVLALLGPAIFLAMITVAPALVGASDTPMLPTAQPTFDPLTANCLGIAAPDPQLPGPLPACGAGQTLTLGGVPTANVSVQLLKGRPLTLPTGYSGPGWRTTKDDGTATPPGPALGSAIGGVSSVIDLFCDGVQDKFSKGGAAPPGWTPEIYWRVTTAWSATSEDTTIGAEGGAGYPVYRNKSGLYLDQIVPPPGVASRVSRTRADITTVYAGTDGSVAPSSTVGLTQPTPLNQVWLHPSWSPEDVSGLYTTASTEAGATLSITNLGGAPSVPSAQLLCLQAPQNSIAVYSGIGSTGCGTLIVATCGLVGNPLACTGPIVATSFCGEGWYVKWTTFLSAADITSNAEQFVIVPQFYCISAIGEAACKAAHTDADKDGLESCATAIGPTGTVGTSTNFDGTAPMSGRPCELAANDAVGAVTCPAGPAIVAVSTHADRDCDGLLDGIEVAWGSNPGTPLTNVASPKRDSEKMLGPGYALTDPSKSDTDGDGVLDGGLNLIDGSGSYDANGVMHARVPRDPVSDQLLDTTTLNSIAPLASASISVVADIINSCISCGGPLNLPVPLYLESGTANAETVVVTAIAGGGPFTYTLQNPTGLAHAAGKPVIDNPDCTPGPCLANGAPAAPWTGDNCPNSVIPNPAQTNTASGRLGYSMTDPGTGWPLQAALPAHGTQKDQTNPAKSFLGDVCNADVNHDNIPDLAEAGVRSQGAGGDDCNIVSPAGVSAPTSAGVAPLLVVSRVQFGGTTADNDGDRVTNGRECEIGTPPRNNGNVLDTGNISCGGCGTPAFTVAKKLAYLAGNQNGDWADFMRITGIGTSNLANSSCGSGQICNPSNFKSGVQCTNPCRADSDGDKIPDAVETYVWGTSPANVDSDRDGCSDTVEILAVDGTTSVGFPSLLKFAAHYGASGPTATAGQYPDPLWDPDFDFAGAGAIGFSDLLLFAAGYGTDCVPAPGQISP